jgi:outer membrane protein assembly factor BamB
MARGGIAVTAPTESPSSAPPQRLRLALLLWPVAVLLVVAASSVAWVWSLEHPQRQSLLHQTLWISLATSLLLALWFLIWWLFLTRVSWRVRSGLLAALLAGALLLVSAIEIQGLTGDAMPILGWRWSDGPRQFEPASNGARTPAKRGALRSVHDYPQFLGPRRDGTVREVRLSRAWPERLEPLWRREVGEGWSAFAVSGSRAVTQEQRGAREGISCYDVRSGELLWMHADETRWEDPLGGPGPRATPTLADGRVYALGGTGLLNVLDLQTGERIWSEEILEQNGAVAPTYGVSSSPLLVGEAVVVQAGGSGGRSLVAYHRQSGERLWAGGDDPGSYSSPVRGRLAGRETILLLTGANVVGHDAANGRLLWSFPWPSTERVSQVLQLPGDRLFVSSGYGVGAKLLQVADGAGEGPGVELVWESRSLKAKFTNVVYRGGFLYGLDDGILACVDATDGRRRWKGGRYGHGQLILVHDLLLVLSEKGRVALVEAVPEAYREIAGFQALDGKTWNHPALAGSLLLVRNDREAACYALPLEEPP